MKKLTVVLLAFALLLSLSSCSKFECSMCGEEKMGSKHSTELFGVEITICNDCYKDIEDIGDKVEEGANDIKQGVNDIVGELEGIFG